LTQDREPENLRQAAADFRRRYYGPHNNPGPPAAMAELAPRVTELVDSVIYGEIYNRPAVNLQTRSLCTIAALTVLGHSPHLIRRHIQGALHVGVTQEQISEIISQMVFYGGMPAAVSAFQVAKETFDDAPEPWPEAAQQPEERTGGDRPAAVAKQPSVRSHQGRPPSNRSPSSPRPPNQRPAAGHRMDRQSSRQSTSRQSKGSRPSQRGGAHLSTRPPARGGGGPGRKRNPGKRR
jgi:4-carboxymuconolactone decarboxylase